MEWCYYKLFEYWISGVGLLGGQLVDIVDQLGVEAGQEPDARYFAQDEGVDVGRRVAGLRRCPVLQQIELSDQQAFEDA